MAHATHANARLDPAGRLMLAQCVVDDHWPVHRAAERFQTSVNTARQPTARCTPRSGAEPGGFSRNRDGSDRGLAGAPPRR